MISPFYITTNWGGGRLIRNIKLILRGELTNESCRFSNSLLSSTEWSVVRPIVCVDEKCYLRFSPAILFDPLGDTSRMEHSNTKMFQGSLAQSVDFCSYIYLYVITHFSTLPKGQFVNDVQEPLGWVLRLTSCCVVCLAVELDLCSVPQRWVGHCIVWLPVVQTLCFVPRPWASG
jgi:hypothetical protein